MIRTEGMPLDLPANFERSLDLFRRGVLRMLLVGLILLAVNAVLFGGIVESAFYEMADGDDTLITFILTMLFFSTVGAAYFGPTAILATDVMVGRRLSVRKAILKALLPSSLVGDLLTAVLLGIVTAHLGIIWAIGRVRLGDAPIAIMLVICFVAWISLAPGLVAEESGVRTALRRGWQMIRVTFGPLVLYSGIGLALLVLLFSVWIILADAAPDSLYDPVAPDSTQSWHAYALYGLFRLGQLVSLAFFYCVVIVLYFDLRARSEGLDLPALLAGLKQAQRRDDTSDNEQADLDHQQPAGDPFFQWFRRPYLPVLWSNRVMPLIIVGILVIPPELWETIDELSYGLTKAIQFDGMLLVWLIVDEIHSRWPGPGRHSPAFATRIATRIWKYRPRQRLNRVMSVLTLTVIVYGVIQPADFHTFAILDATVATTTLIGSVIVASWLAYVLSKCWFQSACEWVSRATGIASNLALTLLFVVMIITVGPDLTLLHGGAIGFILIVAIGGRLIIELLARLPGVDIDSEVSWFPPCFAGGKAPSWW